jgi:hypothetical protein
LTYEQEADNQPLVIGVDPGSIQRCWQQRHGRQPHGRSPRSREESGRHPQDHATGATVPQVAQTEAVQQSPHPQEAHLYGLLSGMGLILHTQQGWQTKALREQYQLKKTDDKTRQRFESHCVDEWVLAASVSGAEQPTCTRLWYVVPARLKHTITLNAYRTTRRLTQKAKVKECRVLTWVAFRSWLVSEQSRVLKGKGSLPLKPQKRNASFLPIALRQGYPEEEI